MTIALVVFATILAAAAIGSALGKISRVPSVVATMNGVGVTDTQIPVLAMLELLGALGLIVGIWIPVIGTASAVALTLYFGGAVAAHLRSHAPAVEVAPAAALTFLALITTILEVAR